MGLLSSALGSVADFFTGDSGDFLGDTLSNAASMASGGSGYGDLLKAGASLFGGLSTNSANAAQAKQQMAFQAAMSGTSYQRGMADMQAAGLNPMLAMSNGGASTPSGASANFSDPITPAVNTAMKSQSVQADVAQTKASTLQTLAGIDTTKSQAELNRASTLAQKANAAKSMVQTNLAAQEIPGAKNQSAADQTWYGRNVKPYMPDILSHSAKSMVDMLHE